MRLFNIGTLLVFAVATAANNTVQTPVSPAAVDLAPSLAEQPQIKPVDSNRHSQNVGTNFPAAAQTNNAANCHYNTEPMMMFFPCPDGSRMNPEQQQACMRQFQNTPRPQQTPSNPAQCRVSTAPAPQINHFANAVTSGLQSNGLPKDITSTPQKSVTAASSNSGHQHTVSTNSHSPSALKPTFANGTQRQIMPSSNAAKGRPVGKKLCCCCCPCCCCKCCCCPCCCDCGCGCGCC